VRGWSHEQREPVVARTGASTTRMLHRNSPSRNGTVTVRARVERLLGAPRFRRVHATAVTYRSDTSEGPTAGTESVDPLAFMARVLVHIPDRGHVTTRDNGWYA